MQESDRQSRGSSLDDLIVESAGAACGPGSTLAGCPPPPHAAHAARPAPGSARRYGSSVRSGLEVTVVAHEAGGVDTVVEHLDGRTKTGAAGYSRVGQRREAPRPPGRTPPGHRRDGLELAAMGGARRCRCPPRSSRAHMRRQREPLEGHVAARLVDPPPELVRGLHVGALRRHETAGRRRCRRVPRADPSASRPYTIRRMAAPAPSKVIAVHVNYRSRAEQRGRDAGRAVVLPQAAVVAVA